MSRTGRPTLFDSLDSLSVPCPRETPASSESTSRDSPEGPLLLAAAASAAKRAAGVLSQNSPPDSLCR